ncbi:MAG: polysaccharide biosynthesis protein [Bacilli bacterium]|nr:polysaccharide biosynthesis protein [Bacilli bacterium]
MKKNSFIEGTLIATFFIVLIKILGMVYVVPFYSIVGSQGAALYSYAYNIYLIFLSISSAGIPNAISKIISEYDTLGYIEAKTRAYKLSKKIITILSIVSFLALFIFARSFAHLILGDMTGGNTISDVTFVIRCVATSILVVPFLSVTKGYLQGHKFMTPSSVSQLLEQIVRIAVILIGSFTVYKLLNQSLTLAVGISLLGAFFGAVAADIYLLIKIRKNKNKLNLDKEYEKDKITNKEIIKKIIYYSIPIIIINLITNIYSSTDMILVSRTIQNLGYSATDVEFITSSISTWCPKISMIVNSIVLGMTMSLIPNIVSSYVENDFKNVNLKINKALQIIVFASLPLTVGICILSTPIWTIFYNTNQYGGLILQFNIFTALLVNINLSTSTMLQSMNKFKAVYIAVIAGFLANGLLDVPLMYLCKYIGIESFLGSIFASFLGYILSISLNIHFLKKESKDLKFKNTINIFYKSMFAILVMVISLLILNNFLNFDIYSKLGAIITIIINSVIGGIIYIFITYKLNVIEDIFGKSMINKFKTKLHIKVSD